MATQRYISTSFWDDGWVQELTPHQRYLYLYLLTNPLTNIAGAYKITDKRIMFDTGLTQAQLTEIMRGFTKSRKAVRHGEWIIIPAWPDHQKWDSSPKIKKGIEALLRTFSPEILGVMVQVGYRYPIDTLSIPYTYPSNYLDSDLDSDSNPPLPPLPAKRSQKKTGVGYPEDFSAFWDIYPRKVGKGDAHKSWKRAVKIATPEAILGGLQNQIRAHIIPKIENGNDFTPHPATWLNGNRWEDDVPRTPAPPDTRPTKFRVQPIIDPETGEELEPVRTLEYPTFEAMEAAMKTMQVDRKDDVAGYWLFTEAGYAHQIEAAKRKRGMFSGLLRKI